MFGKLLVGFGRPKKEKKVGEGSTMIPVFPHVDMDTPDLASRTLNYNDVPKLRWGAKIRYILKSVS